MSSSMHHGNDLRHQTIATSEPASLPINILCRCTVSRTDRQFTGVQQQLDLLSTALRGTSALLRLHFFSCQGTAVVLSGRSRPCVDCGSDCCLSNAFAATTSNSMSVTARNSVQHLLRQLRACAALPSRCCQSSTLVDRRTFKAVDLFVGRGISTLSLDVLLAPSKYQVNSWMGFCRHQHVTAFSTCSTAIGRGSPAAVAASQASRARFLGILPCRPSPAVNYFAIHCVAASSGGSRQLSTSRIQQIPRMLLKMHPCSLPVIAAAHCTRAAVSLRCVHHVRGQGTMLVRGLHGSAAREKTSDRRGLDTAMYVSAVVVFMLGLSYAAVPLYQMFCQATGYAGTVKSGKSVEDKIRQRQENPNPTVEEAAAAREITVWFSADVAEGLDWKFEPTQDSVTVKPGESTLVFFTAHNLSDKAITGVSTYNVLPDKAAYYFNKIQCFCFEEQRLQAGEKVDMPVFFYIDPEYATDRYLTRERDLTLSYTFFKVEDEEEDDPVSTSANGLKLHGTGELPPGIAPPKP